MRAAAARAMKLTVPTTIRIGSRRLHVFQLCALSGLIAAAAALAALAPARGVPALSAFALFAGATVAFLAVALGTKVVKGEEVLVYYHHELAIFAVAALIGRLAGPSAAACLDLAALGLGVVLACGRVGCFLVGCCHGRPSRAGIAYGHAHVAEGFPGPLAGVPLFPVQLVESIAVAAVVIAGGARLLGGAPPGAVFTFYVMAYGATRFGLELLRGDPARPCYAGVSQAQWISVLLAAGVMVAEARGALPRAAWHAPLAAALVALTVLLIVRHRARTAARCHPLA